LHAILLYIIIIRKKLKKEGDVFWTVFRQSFSVYSNLHNIHHKKSLVLHLEENVP